MGEFLDDVLLTVPETVTPPEPGATVRATGYLRRSPGFADVPAGAIGAWRLAVKTQALLVTEKSAPWCLAPSNALRRRFDLSVRRAGAASEERLPGKGYIHLHRGDVISLVGAGGGGFGAPAGR